jgi:hypothetical protein
MTGARLGGWRTWAQLSESILDGSAPPFEQFEMAFERVDSSFRPRQMGRAGGLIHVKQSGEGALTEAAEQLRYGP